MVLLQFCCYCSKEIDLLPLLGLGAPPPSIMLMLLKRITSSSSWSWSLVVVLLLLWSCYGLKEVGLPPLVVLVMWWCSSFNLANVVPKSSILLFLVSIFCGGAPSSILYFYSKVLDLPPPLGLGGHEVVLILLQSHYYCSKELHPLLPSLWSHVSVFLLIQSCYCSK